MPPTPKGDQTWTHRHPYLNFVREFKRVHPRYNLKRLLQKAANAWKKLRPPEKMSFTQQVCFRIA